MEDILFLNMFSLYTPPESLQELLAQAAIHAAHIDPERRSIHVCLACPAYISAADLRAVSSQVCERYGLQALELERTFPPEQLPQMDRGELEELFIAENPMLKGTLAGAKWHWAEDALQIQLLANGRKLVEEAIPAVRRKLYELCGAEIGITVEAGKDLEGQALFEAMEKIRSEMIGSFAQARPAAPAKAEAAPQKTDSIYGRPFKAKPIPMKDVSLDSGFVTVEGKVFSIEHKELKKRSAWIIKFDMTDHTGSVRISKFMESKEAAPVLDAIKKGSVLRVQGKMMVDKFDGEPVLQPTAITTGSMPKRLDTAEGMKRVELHLHTTMSAMDALTPVADAVKQAAAWGHRAIAITDHGVAHCFPDAMKAASKAKVAGTEENIKVLYGVEGYYFNDVDDRPVVRGAVDIALEDEYIALDLETTGLSFETETVTEIGAILMKNGQELDRFQTLVDPGRKLTAENSKLTGITDAMLIGAPKIGEVMPKLLEFIGGRPVVAHNADFDITFLHTECKRLGIPFEATSVDTLPLSQNLLPHMNRHQLHLVADALDLQEFNHHRAGDDALICGLIFHKLSQRLRELGASRLQQINAVMPSQRLQYWMGRKGYHHIVILAKNQQGLRNLYHLISDSNLKYFKGKPRIPKSQLMELREGLIIGSACEAGEVFQAILDGKSEERLLELADFYDYLEIQPISNNAFMLRPEKEGKPPRAENEEQLRDYNRTVVRLGEKLGKPVVATGDVHFLNPEDEIFRHILLASMKFSDADAPNPLYFRTTDDMLREFAYLGEEKAYEVVVKNPNYIADMVERLRPVPHNLFAPKIENSVEDLKALVYGKLHRLYGENPPELFVKRVETELNDIITCHYDVIYMSAQRLVQNSLEHGYLVGSRGSVGSSIVAFMSGITEVNSFPPHYRCPNPQCKHTILDVPKEYNCGADLPDAECPLCGTKLEKDGFNIPFETFLGFGGDKVPDIDLNFSGEYQAKAHAYCIEMFGPSHVFRAGTIGTVAEKTAFGYAKKYLDERGKKASRAEENRLAAGCVGVRRSTGQHPGGLVVIPQENEIWDFCPVQHPADDMNSDQITTHFEYHSMEENLLKLDMLGHDDPTMIRMMEDMTGVDAKTIPLDDKETMSIFTSSKVLGYEDDKILGPTGAVGVPEFNTRFTRGVLLDTMPTKFDFLVRICGYTHGTDVWLGNARDLITSKTATVDQTIGARDDIMLYLISMGLPEKRAFKIMESVRKGRGLPDGAEEEMRNANVPEWYITSCKKIKYLFPKAHAVAYCMMAFRIAWFKVHQPLAFYSAYFYRRSQKGGFDAALMTGGMESVMANIKAIDGNENATDKDEDLLITLEVAYEFYLRGFEFLPVSFAESHSTRFLIKDAKLLPPFVAISGLGQSAAEDLEKCREGKTFISIEEVAAACPKVSKTHIQTLKDLGAFGDLPDTSQVSLF